MGSAVPKRFNVQNIAVIGAGPCGLAAAKYLVTQNSFADIVVFEQRDEVGGVWYYSNRPSRNLYVPQTDPNCPPDPPLVDPPSAPVFPSPMYEYLNTNIPGPLMQFSDLAFPEEALIFPPRQAVQDYLVQYSQDVRHLIQFCTQVEDVRLRREHDEDVWDVISKSTLAGDVTMRTFDAVVVASGHYATTFLPDVANIREFHSAHPDVITHAKLYRDPSYLKGKKVVVVGNSASGLDIGAQISRVCKGRLLLSVHTPTPEAVLRHVDADERPVIEEFIVRERGVRFSDGTVEKDIDAVVYCTGYLFGFPFLQRMDPPLVTNGRRVYGLYKDLIHIDHPTLAFPGLPIKVVPFPLSESQAATIARAWANDLELPSAEEMHRWEDNEAAERGSAFHVFPKGGDSLYINGTYDWIVGSSSRGKMPPRWSDRVLWMRKIYAEARLKFEQTGRKAKTLEELGFHQPAVGEDQVVQELL
jgi:thioredoxin reductase